MFGFGSAPCRTSWAIFRITHASGKQAWIAGDTAGFLLVVRQPDDTLASMTDDQIQQALDRMNAGKADDVILRPISRDVWWGNVWCDPVNVQTEGYEFFFVRKSKLFVAAVFRMGRDEMHWYVSPTHRGQGVLGKPLKQTILPFIFVHHDEKSLECSVTDGPFATASERLARKVGFRPNGEDGPDRYFSMKRPARLREFKLPRFAPSLADIEALDRETQRALRSVKKITDRLRLQHEGNSDAPAYRDFSDGLEAMLGEVADFADKMEWKLKAQSKP